MVCVCVCVCVCVLVYIVLVRFVWCVCVSVLAFDLFRSHTGSGTPGVFKWRACVKAAKPAVVTPHKRLHTARGRGRTPRKHVKLSSCVHDPGSALPFRAVR